MARPKKESKQAQISGQWQDKLEKAEKYRTKLADDYKYTSLIEAAKGKWDLPNPDVTPNNYVWSWLKTEVASLYLRDPHIEVNPLKTSTIQQAKLRELLLADVFRRKKVKREVKKALWDAKLVNQGWIKTGYLADFKTQVDAEGNPLETIENEDFFISRIPWNMILVNPEAIDPPFDAEWIAHEFWVQEDEVRKNKKFKNTEQLKGQPLNKKKPADGKKRNDNSGTSYSTGSFVRLFEIWDRKNKKRIIFSLEAGVIFEQPWPYTKMKGFPFSCLVTNPENDEMFGTPEISFWIHQVFELMKVDFLLIDHVKKYGRQMIDKPGNLTDESREAYEQGETGVILEALDPSQLKPVPYPTAPQDLYPIRKMILENILNTNGQPAHERGATQSLSTRTFKELAKIDEGAKNRKDEQRDLLEDFLEDIASNFLALFAQYADSEYYVQVTGRQPQEVQEAIEGRPSAQEGVTLQGPSGVSGFSLSPEDVGDTMDFDVEVKAGSTIPLDKDNKLEVLKFALEAGPAAGAAPGGPLMGAIARELFDLLSMPELQMALDDEAQFQQAQQEKAQEQQNQAMQMQTALEAANVEIKAQREASRHMENQLRALKLAVENNLGQKKVESDLRRMQDGQSGKGSDSVRKR